MFQSIAQVRKWLIAGVVVLVVGVSVSYWFTRFRVGPTLHSVPTELGVDIQQTSDGFSLSKSEAGRTLYTIRASKAVQFKSGGRADLHNVHIVVYGHAPRSLRPDLRQRIHLRPCRVATSMPSGKSILTCKATPKGR